MLLQYLPTLTACLSAIAMLLFRGHVKAAKYIAVATNIALFALPLLLKGNSLQSMTLMPLAILLALACIACQQIDKDAVISIATTVFITGLLFPALYGEPLIAKVASGVLFLTLALVSLFFRKSTSLGSGAAISFSASLIFITLSVLVKGHWALIFQVLAPATLLPLFPFQAAYIGVLNNLPGTLPAFLALALPLVGWRALNQTPTPAGDLTQAISILVLLGSLVTGARASVQAGLNRIFAAIATLLLAPAWWIFVSTAKLDFEALPYIMAVGLVIGGLRLCAYFLELRYGTQVLESLPGLAGKMPKFGVVFSLLIMAGIGTPLFAVFSASVVLLISALQAGISHLIFLFLVWLVCFVIQISVLQRLLFNQARSNLLYSDLSRTELISLAVILALLLLGGIFPKLMLELAT